MEAVIKNNHKKAIGMSDAKNCIISILSGFGTAAWNWDKVVNESIAILEGVIVGVSVAIIVHYFQIYWWKTKNKKSDS